MVYGDSLFSGQQSRGIEAEITRAKGPTLDFSGLEEKEQFIFNATLDVHIHQVSLDSYLGDIHMSPTKVFLGRLSP